MSSNNAVIPIILALSFLSTIGVIYGTLELSDDERNAWEVLKDLLSGKISLQDIWRVLSGRDAEAKAARACQGVDQNGVYEYDEKGDCTFLGCKPGYYEQDNVCIERRNFSGEVFSGQTSVDCVIDGYTYGECIPKLNETCGEGVGQQLKTPNITTGTIGNGSCESATYVDCDIKCPDPSTCGTSLKCCGDSDYKPDNVCKDDGYMTYTLDSTNCDANGLPETKEVECYYQGDWKATGECESKDGTWKEKFTRLVKNSKLAQSGTDTKVVKHEDTSTCDPVNCQGNWSNWSACSETCDGGTQNRTWTTLPGGQPKFGGQACPSPNQESRQCNTTRCCGDSDYKPDNVCKDDGYMTYTLDSTNCDANGLPVTKEVDCCYRSDWVNEDGCHEDGSVWKRKQTRTIKNSGLCGDDKSITQFYEDSACDAVDCVMSEWVNEGACSADGIQKQIRSVKSEAKYGGADCGSTSQEVTCPVNCVMSEWVNDGACRADGIQKQIRSVISDAKNGGAACGSTTQEVTCPVNCTGDWGDWGACDCGTGEKTKSWFVTNDEINGGSCENRGKTKSTDCDRTKAGCPVVCKVKDSRLDETYCKYEYDYDDCVNKRAGYGNQKVCTWIPEPAERGGGWLFDM